MNTESVATPAPAQKTPAFAKTDAEFCPRPIQLKHILVPIDLSMKCLKALEYAASFASQYGAKITLLHLIDPADIMGEAAPAFFPPLNGNWPRSANVIFLRISRPASSSGTMPRPTAFLSPPTSLSPISSLLPLTEEPVFRGCFWAAPLRKSFAPRVAQFSSFEKASGILRSRRSLLPGF